ncbi:hypothetical protein [Clostridium sp. 'White wine YQ']|uniref:hypothetical protein n=1 Tax=Clostridium sp. 'White wine YQ' TaxID=3027474 RepID=UPI0023650477|nr:hypothetical protein [Clostridium sp. 'White wine YQ']MDD7792877.1 hypothetical protein [Clostridium sp. 'White wine YQ']
MIAIVIFSYIVIVFFDLIELYKNNIKRDFYVALILCITSFVVAILLSLDVKIPSPAKPIADFIKYLFRWIK